jgi:NitT/TauT family transport system substrate-binding protein
MHHSQEFHPRDIGWKKSGRIPKKMAKVRLIFVALLLVATSSATFAADRLRIGVQSTGTFAWQLDVVRRHGLAEAANLNLIATEMASPDAGKLALNADTVDIAVVDWLWVARERALGMKLQFYPYSTAVGAIMTRNDSPIRSLADLKGRTLSIAGGPLDKSWLIVQAAAIRHSIDLKRETTLQYGAPPLIYQKLLQGEAEASLNFWNFCAQLESRGYRRLYDVREAETELGLKEPLSLTGYVFPESFATAHKDTIERFLSVVRQANDILLNSDPEWDALRPLMRAEDDATFLAFRQRTRQGLPRRSAGAEETDARALFKVLAEIAGPGLVGPGRELDPGLYYHPSSGGE